MSALLWVVGVVGLGLMALCIGLVLSWRIDVASYAHGPTADLYETYDLDAPKLAPFTAAGVVVAPHLTDGWAEIKLSFLAREPVALTLQRLRVSGVGSLADRAQVVAIDHSLTAAALRTSGGAAERGLSAAHHVVALPITGRELREMSADGLQLTVELRAADGAEHSVDFAITTATRKRIAWPT